MFFIRNNNNRNDVDLFDEAGGLFNNMFSLNGDFMKTDIIEEDNNYKIMVDVPGVTKDKIKIAVEDGYLTISITDMQETKTKEDSNKYVRHERTYKKGSRSFYVGNNVKDSDIKASFKDGVLNVNVPKMEETKETKKYIEIE